MTRPSFPQRTTSKRAFAYSTLAIAATLALGAGEASAFDIDAGNPDFAIRFDNTVRANYGMRVESRDSKIGNTAIADEGDYSFDNGQAIAKRVDLLSEFDLVYKKRYGLRVSGAAWYDGAYGDTSKSNPNPPLVGIPSYVGNRVQLDRQAPVPCRRRVPRRLRLRRRRPRRGPVQAKLGRHTIYWGESLFLGGHLHSVSYAQAPLDLQKGFATPGTEVKELFRPLNQLSLQAQVTDTLSVAGQYMLEWESARYPEGGTYYGPVDFVFNGPDRQFLSGALGFASRGPAAEPSQHGEFGLTARWSPEWLDGSMGFYYRNFADKLPQVLLTKVGPASASQYNMVYADRIQLFGVSIAKNIAGISTSAEISYRKDTPLFAQVLGIAVGLPGQGDTKGPRGDTLHGLANAIGTIPKTPLFDAATWAAELAWSHLVSVNSGANLFNGVGYAPCVGKDKWDRPREQGLRRHRRQLQRPPGTRSCRESTCRRR